MHTETERLGAVSRPPATIAWGIVALLFLAYICSFIDRTIISLLLDPIKTSLGLTDMQLGMVSGAAFGIFYSLMGLPLGYAVDRYRRMTLLALGILLWSAATFLCGLATGYGFLFVARMFVGIGEATLNPAAISLISDLFKPERRSLAIAVFVSAGSLGGGLAMTFGGLLLGWLDRTDTLALAFLGPLENWRTVFMLVALPGVLLALVFALCPEPARQYEYQSTTPDGRGGALDAWQQIRPDLGVYVPLMLAMSFVGLFAYGALAWLPTFFAREHGWTLTDFGITFGPLFMLGGGAGAIAGGYLASRLKARGHTLGNFIAVIIGAAIMLPVGVGAALVPDDIVSLGLFTGLMFALAFCSPTAVAAIQDLCPTTARGRMTAMYYLVMNFVGLTLGAPTVAWLSAWLGKASGSALGPAIGVVGAVTSVLALVLAVISLSAAKSRLT